MIVEDLACMEYIRLSEPEAHQPAVAEGFAVGVPQAEYASGGIRGRANLLCEVIPSFFNNLVVSCNSPSLFHERRKR
jgi:hypothetical protein